VKKKDVVTPGNWKTRRQSPYAIAIEAFSNPWKKAEKMKKPA
jgi:hypothetical protein